MKTQSTSQSVIHNTFTRFLAAVLLIAAAALPAGAQELKLNNPYTIHGLQVRTHLWTEEENGRMRDMGPMVFQEVVPCRFVSTLNADQYPHPWGGDEFAPNESRTYTPVGIMRSGDFTNPCSEIVPVESIAVALRVMSYEAEGDGTIYLAPASYERPIAAHAIMKFEEGKDSLKEANVVLHQASFRVTASDHATDLTIDIIGYFLNDPNGGRGDKGDKGDQGERGEQGEKGDRGDAGAQGEKGSQGERGEKGDRGEAGAQGEKGDRGDAGAQGEKGSQGERGEKGDRGDAGAQGEKGEKGDRGDAGAQGEKGDRGEAGAQGVKGEQGERGEKGDTGAQGEKGEQGDRGDAGAQGEKGDRGETGAQGERGEQGQRGEKGGAGAQGEKGEKGDQGPQGPAGPVSSFSASFGPVYIFPPGGNITISDGAVTPNSFVIIQYVEDSRGNVAAVEQRNNGSFHASGSPNKAFRYIVFNQ